MKKPLLFVGMMIVSFSLFSQTVGFFNIRRLGDMQKDYIAVASIVKEYDVCGIVEVMNDKGLKLLVSSLGSDWEYLISEKEVGRTRYKEYYGIVWNTKKASVKSIGFFSDPLDKFERDPYAFLIKIEKYEFVYILSHIIFGDSIKDRRAEVSELPIVYFEFNKKMEEKFPIVFSGDFNLDNTRNDFNNILSTGFIFAQSEKTSLGRTDLVSSYDHFLFYKTFFPFVSSYGVTNPINRLTFKKYYTDVSDHLPIYFKLK